MAENEPAYAPVSFCLRIAPFGHRCSSVHSALHQGPNAIAPYT